MKNALLQNLVRLRVPLSWGLGLLTLWLARPTPAGYAAGLTLALLGQTLRIWAAGHLVKGVGVTRSGPYAWTRNPLYLGSTLVGLGFCVAAGRPELLLVLVALMLGVFVPVMKAEALHLSGSCGGVYPDYAKAVPVFFPTRMPRAEWLREKPFAWARVRANREHVTLAGCMAVALLLGLKLALRG